MLLKVIYDDPKNIRRIPTSYLWFKISENTDCLPINCTPVKTKEYLSDGMTLNLLPLKINYPKYLVKLYKIALENKKYNSITYRIRYKILFLSLFISQ